MKTVYAYPILLSLTLSLMPADQRFFSASAPSSPAPDVSEFDPLGIPKKRLSLTIPSPVGSPPSILLTPPSSNASSAARKYKIKKRVPSINPHLGEPRPETGQALGSFLDESFADHSPVRVHRSLVIKSLKEINDEKALRSINSVIAAVMASNKISYSFISLLEQEAMALAQNNQQFLSEVQNLRETRKNMASKGTLYFSPKRKNSFPQVASDDEAETL
jgi:hypothetical protein